MLVIFFFNFDLFMLKGCACGNLFTFVLVTLLRAKTHIPTVDPSGPILTI
jgi:hypothetical protein